MNTRLKFLVATFFIFSGSAVAAKYPGPCSELMSQDLGDGTTDDHFSVYSYDENKRMWRKDVYLSKKIDSSNVFRSYTYRFDKDGNAVEERDVIRGSLSSIEQRSFDSNGKILESRGRYYDDEGSGREQWSKVDRSEYDEKGRLLLATTFHYDPNFQNERKTREIEYTWKDDMTAEVRYYLYNEQGREGRKTLSFSTLKTFDHGKMIKEIDFVVDKKNYTETAQVNSVRDITFDTDGNLTQSIDKDGAGKLLVTETYVYDADGNKVKGTFVADGFNATQTFDYSCWENK